MLPLEDCLSRLPLPYLASRSCFEDILFCGGGFTESYSPISAEGMYILTKSRDTWG